MMYGDGLLNDFAPPGAYRYLRIKSLMPGSNGGGVGVTEINVVYDGIQNNLTGKPVVNLGSAFNTTYKMDFINDGIVGTTNGQSLAYVPEGIFDIRFDLITPHIYTAIMIAPQFYTGPTVLNTPKNLTFLGSNDDVNWVQFPTSHTNITTGVPAWTPGAFRTFATGF